jgi:two-component system, NtrC family, nitrogen regulation response regulator NtrX
LKDILIVDDEKDIRDLIAEILKDEGFKVRVAGNSGDCLKEIEADPPAVLVLDIWLKDSEMDGIDILKATKKNNPEIPILIISGHGNIEIAVAAIKQGAYDFVEKPFNTDQLIVVVKRAFEKSKLRQENLSLKKGDVDREVLVGQSSTFKSMQSQLEKVSSSNARVMLSGEAGSGKEAAARVIHNTSLRKSLPFTIVNCSNADSESFDETLFGLEKDGKVVLQGLLEKAKGGTVLFDEVSELPIVIQKQLLKCLNNQSFERKNGKSKIKIEFRVISSSNKDLRVLIENEKFSSELYHRLNVIPIRIPSLEDRREDIPLLINHFVSQLNIDQGLPIREVSEDALAFLQTMQWPGNIRQLRNLIERVLILGVDKDSIKVNEFVSREEKVPEKIGLTMDPNLAALPLREARENFERDYLLLQINRFGGNISKTASFVGMERSALHRKLKSLNIVTNLKTGNRVAVVLENDSTNDYTS